VLGEQAEEGQEMIAIRRERRDRLRVLRVVFDERRDLRGARQALPAETRLMRPTERMLHHEWAAHRR
jgi:hypothetical protein